MINFIRKLTSRNQVCFSKISPVAIIPSKLKEDAGYDIYACFEADHIIIPAHQTVLIPTGIASACNEKYCFLLRERGSTGSKGLGLRCGVIDSGYRGEWFVCITNHNDVDYAIAKKDSPLWKEAKDSLLLYPYEKAIAQALVVEVPSVVAKEIEYTNLLKMQSKRGVGKIGSSGK